MNTFSNEATIKRLEARKNLLLQRGETMNLNLLRKINRKLRAMSKQ